MALRARGFSQKTCLPAAMSFRVVGWWAGSGVELTAASKPPQAMASSRSPKARGMWLRRGEAGGAVEVDVDGGGQACSRG